MRRHLVGLMTVLVFTCSAMADPELKIYALESDNSTTTFTYSPSANPTVVLPDDTVRVNIQMVYGSPPESPVAVGHITFEIEAPAFGTIDIVVGTGTFVTGSVQMTAGNAMSCSSWRGFTVPDGPIFRLYGRITGDLISSSGSATTTFANLHRLSRFDIDGDLDTAITVEAPAISTFWLSADRFTASGRVKLDTGNITRIETNGDIERPSASGAVSIAAMAGNIQRINVLSGSLRGDVICRGTHDATDPAQGRIFEIVVGDHIGRAFTATQYGDPESSAAFPTLSGSVLNGDVLCIEASNGIDLIEADTMTCLIQPDRSSPQGTGDAPGKLEALVTRTGSFKGLIQCQGIQDNDTSTGPASVDIAGDFRGRARISDPGLGGFHGVFRVRGSLLPLTVNSTAFEGFVIPTGELHGQIIANAADASESWSSAVVVGITTLSHTSGVYTTPSVDLGGGAVGLAPFKFYDVDCIPPNNDFDHPSSPLSSDFAGSAIPVIMRWFGPVKLPTGITNPMTLLIIEAQDPRPGHECEWIDLSNIFTATMHPDGDSRAIGIGSITHPRETVYRVRYNDYAMGESIFFECDQVEGNPPIDFSVDACDSGLDSYMFTVVPDCDANGISDVTEIANDPGLDLDSDGILNKCEFVNPCSCDWDGSGQLHVPDIFDFLSDWFANDPDAYNFGGTPGVPAIFAFLSCWFADECE